MRSAENIRQRIKQNLKKPVLKKQADLEDDSRSPWYDIQLTWNGAPRLFKLHYEDPTFPADTIELKHVFAADAGKDEWIESPKAVLDLCRASQTLMGELQRRVAVLEQSRGADVVKDTDYGIESPDEPASEDLQ